MNINDLIKKTIRDPELRVNFFADPVKTCKRCNPPIDTSIMQGGYRP